MSHAADRVSLGFLPLRHHEKSADVNMRNVLYGFAFKGVDEGGFTESEDNSVGDILGATLWRLTSGGGGDGTANGGPVGGATNGGGNGESGESKRAIPAWMFAWPSVVTIPETGDGNSEGGEHKIRPIRNELHDPDERFEEKSPSIPEWASRLPKKWPGVTIAASEELAQEEVFIPGFCGLVAPSYDGNGHLSTRVFDLDKKDAIEQERWSPLHGHLRVVDQPEGRWGSGEIYGNGAPTSLFDGAKNALALEFYRSPIDDQPGFGLFADKPWAGSGVGFTVERTTDIGGAKNGGARRPAPVFGMLGGTIIAGPANDVHRVGVTAKGESINVGHINCEAPYRWSGPPFDKPGEMDGALLFETEPYPFDVGEGNLYMPVHLRFKHATNHANPNGAKGAFTPGGNGFWQWVAESTTSVEYPWWGGKVLSAAGGGGGGGGNSTGGGFATSELHVSIDAPRPSVPQFDMSGELLAGTVPVGPIGPGAPGGPGLRPPPGGGPGRPMGRGGPGSGPGSQMGPQLGPPTRPPNPGRKDYFKTTIKPKPKPPPTSPWPRRRKRTRIGPLDAGPGETVAYHPEFGPVIIPEPPIGGGGGRGETPSTGQPRPDDPPPEPPPDYGGYPKPDNARRVGRNGWGRLEPNPWERHIAGSVLGDQRPIAGSTLEHAFPAIAYRPQHFGCGKPDLRNDPRADPEATQEQLERSPVVARDEAAFAKAGGECNGGIPSYTHAPGSARYPSGTSNGIIMHGPAEIGFEDAANDFAPPGVNVSTRTDFYVRAKARLGFGLGSPTTGAMKAGFVTDETGGSSTAAGVQKTRSVNAGVEADFLDLDYTNAKIKGSVTFSSPGAGADSERYGVGAVAAGAGGVAIGKQASAAGAAGSVAVGLQASASADGAVAIGYTATAAHTDAIAIGEGAASSASQQIALNTAVEVTDVRLGSRVKIANANSSLKTYTLTDANQTLVGRAGSLTQNTIPKADANGNLADSAYADDGTTATVGRATLAGTGALAIKAASGQDLTLKDGGGTTKLTIAGADGTVAPKGSWDLQTESAAFQHRRGTEAGLPSLASGEIYVATDTSRMFVGV